MLFNMILTVLVGYSALGICVISTVWYNCIYMVYGSYMVKYMVLVAKFSLLDDIAH